MQWETGQGLGERLSSAGVSPWQSLEVGVLTGWRAPGLGCDSACGWGPYGGQLETGRRGLGYYSDLELGSALHPPLDLAQTWWLMERGKNPSPDLWASGQQNYFDSFGCFHERSCGHWQNQDCKVSEGIEESAGTSERKTSRENVGKTRGSARGLEPWCDCLR